jgi:uncharacterized membrane protein
MNTNQLEAFSDGVIAVIITIMVLELRVPRDTTLASLRGVLPQFLSYLLSFLVVAIVWVNHHHLLHSDRRADARLLWSNNTLLFWMSLVPFVTAFMGNNSRGPRAVGLYGVVLALCSVSFVLLRSAIVQHHRRQPGHDQLPSPHPVQESLLLFPLISPRCRSRLSMIASRSSSLGLLRSRTLSLSAS